MSHPNLTMVDEIKLRVKLSQSVENALKSVDRGFFVPQTLKSQAYSLDALPLEESQWISSPLTVAIMTEALIAKGADSVLEVGCGSGYQAMVLSKLFRKVFTIERIETLLVEARRRFELLEAYNILTKLDDGQNGWEDKAPFDAVLFSACAGRIPTALIDQLKEGGVLLAPVLDSQNNKQRIVRFVKHGGLLSEELFIANCSFVDVKDDVIELKK